MEIPTPLEMTVMNTQKCQMQTQLKTAYPNLLEPEESLKLNVMDLKRSMKEGTSSASFVMSEADPGFPQGGGANSPGRCQHTILQNFSKNCMKLKEFGPPGDAHPLCPL